MKLLPKSEVDKRKAAEQRVAVEEGLKLARRVDNLREVASEEEKALEEFRVKTVSTINEEIVGKVQERDALTTEVKILEERRVQALKPFTKERASLDAYKSDLDERGEKLDEREAKIKDTERDTDQANKLARAALAKAETREDLAATTLGDAKVKERAAELALQSATSIKEKAQKLSDEMRKELHHRDMMASARERDVSIKEARLTKEEEEIKLGWKLLNDRREMVERALKYKK